MTLDRLLAAHRKTVVKTRRVQGTDVLKVDASTTRDQSETAILRSGHSSRVAVNATTNSHFQRSGKGQDVPNRSHEIGFYNVPISRVKLIRVRRRTHEFDDELKRIAGPPSRNELRPDDFQISATEVVFVRYVLMSRAINLLVVHLPPQADSGNKEDARAIEAPQQPSGRACRAFP